MPALHTAAYVSAGLLVIAVAVILLRLPAKAEAVAWSTSGSGTVPDNGVEAASRVHTVDEAGEGLAHVASAPLENPVGGRHSTEYANGTAQLAVSLPGATAGRHAAREDDSVPAGAGETARQP
jgi:hypothetical protein